MTTKRLIILANSIKKGGRCVAGREVLEKKGIVSFGDWIRPVSRKGEGELSVTDIRLKGGDLPKIFDVVDVPIQEREVSASQPENWFIDPQKYWIEVEGYEDDLPSVDAETPQDLWVDPSDSTDRITPAKLAELSRGQSLYLIEVTQFRIKIEWNSWNSRHRRRALFRYKGRDYDFGLTDPEMDSHCLPFPASGSDKVVKLDTGGHKVLCVSLTPEFKGNHYKIVATVIEPDE